MNKRLVGALAVSALAVGALVFYAVDATAKPVVTVAELAAGASRKNVRLGARVTGEISHRRLTDEERAGYPRALGGPDAPLERVEFLARDPGHTVPGGSPGGAPPSGHDVSDSGAPTGKDQLRVVYFGVMPPQLKSDRDVILEGDFEQAGGGTFTARELLTQCPSKYEPPKPKAAS